MIRCIGMFAAITLLVAGCGGSGGDKSSGTSSTAAISPTATAATSTGTASPEAPGQIGNIPDPCTLLSDQEVTDLTGRQTIQIDRDGGDANSITRYCQWQQNAGRLGVFLLRTSAADFDFGKGTERPIPDLGDDAYFKDGHLFVLVGTIQIDVYVSAGDESQDIAEAKKVAAALIPKVREFA